MWFLSMKDERLGFRKNKTLKIGNDVTFWMKKNKTWLKNDVKCEWNDL